MGFRIITSLKVVITDLNVIIIRKPIGAILFSRYDEFVSRYNELKSSFSRYNEFVFSL